MATDSIEAQSRAGPHRIGMCARLMHRPPIEMGLSGKALHLKQSVAHHQAIDRLGGDSRVEAVSVGDGVIEVTRGMGALKVSGVQWHLEFQLGREDRLDSEPCMNALLHDVHEKARA